MQKEIKCLLQVSIADEESKFGMDVSELKNLLDSNQFKEMTNIKISGLMGMATNTSNEGKIKSEFKSLKNTFDEIKSTYFIKDPLFEFLSMGMTNDYVLAIEEGSNMVRIGSLIFGARNAH